MNRKSTAKLDFIKYIENCIQKRWYDEKVFESNPAKDDENSEKYFVTFPYPYMNGILHLGHAFSLSKCEFTMGFEKLQGKNTLWGFGLHCTGMPIKSSSDKLKREMVEFGFPPTFPAKSPESEIKGNTNNGKKSKVVAKSGGFKYQWQIMRNNGMSDDEILKFTETDYWLEYFPPRTIDDMKRLGIKVDWRRSFITTDVNPFYDSFVKWQFNRLKITNKIMFGKRETIFSPLDNQPCMDHDRSSGEGVGPQEYTLIKMKMIKPYPQSLQILNNQNIYFIAATLRPETMYGQTNCWVHPDITYVAVETATHGVLVCVERAAKNMSYQDILSDDQGQMNILTKIRGTELMGCGLEAPLCQYSKIYALPMLTIKENKGTGIVTSVPSDSPDDFAALRDLKNKKALREKFNITEDMVMEFNPIPIIEIPEIGNLCAVKIVEDMKIQSQNDTEKLAEAKEICYKHGFYNGKLIVGQYAGETVQKSKEKIQAFLLKSEQAIKYFEPERQVISRSGDECVVASCEQWYLNYRDPQWKDLTRKCLEQVNTFSDEVRRNFEATLDNLHEHACSRSYGLGSRIPWDEQYLVESLSDSTIYMAYYTVAHLLQGDTLNGCAENNAIGIKAEQMDYNAWEYVLGDKDSVSISDKSLMEKLEKMRTEFLYWYPVDLRVSGKDLIPNHLTYYLYNHTAIWPENQEQYWPKNIRANGHLTINNEKMSKSTGNFLTVVDAIEKYSADGMRLALADAGDTIEDANFVEEVADKGLLKLFTFIDWIKETLSNMKQLRKGPIELHADRVFQNVINRTIIDTKQDYSDMMFKRVVKTAFYELQNARDRYVEITNGNLHSGLMMRFIEIQCLLLSPICPHVCEYIWQDLLHKSDSILKSKWPVVDTEVDDILTMEEQYLDSIAYDFRQQMNQRPKNKKDFIPPNKATIWIARTYPDWQMTILNTLVDMSSQIGVLPENKDINKELGKYPELKKRMKKVMDFIQFVRAKCGIKVEDVEKMKRPILNELKVVSMNLGYLERTLKLNCGNLEVMFSDESGDDKLIDVCCPGEPRISTTYEDDCKKPQVLMDIVNPQIGSGLLSYKVPIGDNDCVRSVIRKLAKMSGFDDVSDKLSLYRYKDSKNGCTALPNQFRLKDDLVELMMNMRFVIDNGNVMLKADKNTLLDVGKKLKILIEC